jgi:hypothetical protein
VSAQHTVSYTRSLADLMILRDSQTDDEGLVTCHERGQYLRQCEWQTENLESGPGKFIRHPIHQQPQNTGQPGAPAGRIASPEKKATTALLNIRPASPQKKLDFPLINQNARTYKIKPETNKENAVIALPVATLGLAEKPIVAAVQIAAAQMGVMQDKQKVMQDKTGNEVNKQNDRVVAAM